MGEGEIDAQIGSKGDDLGFGEVEERRDDLHWFALNADARGEASGMGEATDEFGATVGVATVIDGVDTDVDARGVVDFGHGGGEREEDKVAGGDVGDGDVRGHLGGGAVFGDGDVVGEGGATEDAEIERERGVLERAEALGDIFGGGEFVAMALAVVDSEGAAGKAIAAGDGEGGGAVEAAGEKNDGGGGGGCGGR